MTQIEEAVLEAAKRWLTAKEMILAIDEARDIGGNGTRARRCGIRIDRGAISAARQGAGRAPTRLVFSISIVGRWGGAPPSNAEALPVEDRGLLLEVLD